MQDNNKSEDRIMQNQKRRELLIGAGALAGAAMLPSIAFAQSAKLRVGLMLPYTGTFAQLGVAIENGFRLALEQAGGKFGGREVEFFKVDDESDPAKATENANRRESVTRLKSRTRVDLSRIAGTHRPVFDGKFVAL